MLISIKNFIFILFFIAAFLILPFLLDLNFNIVGMTFYMNVLFCVIYIGLSLKKNISSILFYYIFNLLFMSFIPWINYSNNVVFWSNNIFSNSDYIFANIILFFFNFLIFLFYNLFPISISKELKILKEPNFFIAILICSLSLFVVLYAFDFNLNRVFFRGREDDLTENTSVNPFFSIFVMLSRLLPAFILMRYLVAKKYFKASIILIFVLLCAFPTGIARFLVAFIYLPLLLTVIPFLRKSINITLLIIFSIIIIFPFLNQFRYFSSDSEIKLLPEAVFFNQAHFDAYQNFVEVLRVDFVTHGYQLLGVLFFFVPRFLWNDKPFGSGYQLSLDQGYAFNNISMPFIAEGYVNFGYLGFIIFSIFLAFCM
ncbi:TPA: hypothetical protein ACJK0A_004171, partial [Acinetobacter baumannii]